MFCVFFTCVLTVFGQATTPEASPVPIPESWKFTISVISESFATETVLFTTDGTTTHFEGKTAIAYQDREGVFLTTGTIDDSRIFEYSLNATYNGVITEIRAFADEDSMVVSYKDKTITVPWEENTILLDNNVSYMWQVFLKHLPYAGTDDFVAIIPQLIVSSDVIAYPLTIQRMSESDGQITLTIKLVNSSGIIKTDSQYQLNFIQIGATKVERKE
jgi:hypothetical protein